VAGNSANRADAARGLVCLGVVLGAHGVQGAVRIKSFTSQAEAVAGYGVLCDEQGRPRYHLSVKGSSRGAVLATIEGVEDRTGAEALKGAKLYLPREALPETEAEEYYHADLIGLRAERLDGSLLGTVCAVHDHGAGDVLEIECDDTASILVPFTKETVPEVDVSGGRLVVETPEDG
jgi:16S rRNA processing protein RimM